MFLTTGWSWSELWDYYSNSIFKGAIAINLFMVIIAFFLSMLKAEYQFFEISIIVDISTYLIISMIAVSFHTGCYAYIRLFAPSEIVRYRYKSRFVIEAFVSEYGEAILTNLQAQKEIGDISKAFSNAISPPNLLSSSKIDIVESVVQQVFTDASLVNKPYEIQNTSVQRQIPFDPIKTWNDCDSSRPKTRLFLFATYWLTAVVLFVISYVYIPIKVLFEIGVF